MVENLYCIRSNYNHKCCCLNFLWFSVSWIVVAIQSTCWTHCFQVTAISFVITSCFGERIPITPLCSICCIGFLSVIFFSSTLLTLFEFFWYHITYLLENFYSDNITINDWLCNCIQENWLLLNIIHELFLLCISLTMCKLYIYVTVSATVRPE